MAWHHQQALAAECCGDAAAHHHHTQACTYYQQQWVAALGQYQSAMAALHQAQQLAPLHQAFNLPEQASLRADGALLHSVQPSTTEQAPLDGSDQDAATSMKELACVLDAFFNQEGDESEQLLSGLDLAGDLGEEDLLVSSWMDLLTADEEVGCDLDLDEELLSFGGLEGDVNVLEWI